MVRLSCFDLNGNPIEAIYQWDVERIIKIEGVTVNIGMNYELHFSNRRTSVAYAKSVHAMSNEDILMDSADFIIQDVDNNIITVPSDEQRENANMIATIPLKFLEEAETIVVYVVELDEDTGERWTVADLRIPVIPRQMPSDYVSTKFNPYTYIANGLVIDEDTGMIMLAMDGEPFGEGTYI